MAENSIFSVVTAGTIPIRVAPAPRTSGDLIIEQVAQRNDFVMTAFLKTKFAEVMSYHLVNGTYFSEGLYDRQYLVTEIEERLPVSCAVSTDTFFSTYI
jgi:hypothetical protein